MYFAENTLDDLLRAVLKELRKSPVNNHPTRGACIEVLGATLRLTNPRARITASESKKMLFSALGELLWYLSGSNSLSFISYYIKKYNDESLDGKTVYGAYGPRLLNYEGNYNQIENVCKLLLERRGTRRAVIQLFSPQDIAAEYKEIPCTCTLQFFIRDEKLHLITTMRSNDAYLGLPHDIFAFTMIQEIIARRLNVELGYYTHFVGSLHLYKDKILDAEKYLSEGVQPSIEMPQMPQGDPRPAIESLLELAKGIRENGILPNLHECNLHQYWSDLLTLLKIYHTRGTNVELAKLQKMELGCDAYGPYLSDLA